MKKVILYVPGLNDDRFLNRNLTQLLPFSWQVYGYEVLIFRPVWRSGTSFSPKLKRIINTIDNLSTKGYSISLFGQSAGGAAVLNAYIERKNNINKMVSICGRLKKGDNVTPSLHTAAKGSPAFADSVLLFETQNERKLTKDDRKKVLTIRPIWDDVVPSETVALQGATNIVIPMIQHSLGGIAALTLFSSRIASFLAS